ncbi:hypothetical protein ACWPKO_17890 [Coraliomargarita sp. W4R53]
MSKMNLSYFRVFSASTYLCVFLCWGQILAPLGASAQTSAASESEEPLQVSFRVYLWPQAFDISGYLSDDQGGGGYHYVAPKIAYRESLESDIKSIDANEGRLSEVYRYSGAGPLVFFSETDGGAVPVPLGSLTADQLTGGEVLLIFFPSKGKDGPAYNILPVEAPTKRIPDGQAMFYNLTKETLALHTGKRPKILEPRGVALMDLGREKDNLVPLRIMVKVNDNGEWVIRHTEYQTISDDEKLLFFVFPRDAESNRVRVLSINAAL